ncbi:MAG TPA: hypothetical protein PK914_10715 [Smithellaceae bacterium]|nr:hypothetical protein [Smithellaceae bacterium]
MFRKQMFTIAFIVLLSGLIINTMGCQQCKDFLEMPEKVKKTEKELADAKKELKDIKIKLQQPIPPPIPPEPSWLKKLIDSIIIIMIIIGAVLGLKHLWIYFNRNKKD